MKKISNFIFTIFLFYASFYYTNIISSFIKNKDPLMLKIKESSKKYYQKPQSAIIHNNTIIPGLKGLEIDIDNSYKKMKRINSFQESLLIYKTIEPVISIKDHKDKLIIQGNPNYKNIIFLLKINDINLLKKLIYKNSSINLILELKFIEENNEYLNTIPNNIIVLETNKLNNIYLIDYCYILKDFKNYCQIYNKYTIYPEIINYDYYYNTYQTITNGKIFAYNIINENNVKTLKQLEIAIKNLGYQIVSLDKLIEE